MQRITNERLERLKAALPADVDGMLVSCETNIRYLCGFDYTDGYAVVTRGKSYVLADFRYIEAAREESGEGWEVVLLTGNRQNLISSLFDENGAKRIAFEDTNVTVSSFEGMKKNYPSYEWVPAGNVIERLREYKDDSEIDTIIAAQRIAEQAFDHILGYINPDRTETDVALELEFYMRSHGASGSAFDVIAASGSASSRPHAVPRKCRLEKGFITMDFGAVINGYRSDMTRTVCLGKADDEMKRMYSTCLEAQLAALEIMNEGVKLAECDKVARDIIDNAGYKGCFGHSLGHGVGLYIHEAPGVHGGAGEKLLTRGHVVTCEPGIYVEGKYGVRIEDMVVCSSRGAENITKAPKQLIEL